MKRIFIQILVIASAILIIFLIFQDFEVYFEDLLSSMKNNKAEYSIFSFLILVSDILLPVPSSVIMLSNGYVLGAVNGFFLSYISANVAAIFGYYLGKLATNKFGIEVSPDANRFLSRYGLMAIILSRGVPILSESVSIVCGYNRVGFRKYLILSLSGYLPVCVVYSWLVGMDTTRNIFIGTFLAFGFISLILWYWGKRHRQVNHKQTSKVVTK